MLVATSATQTLDDRSLLDFVLTLRQRWSHDLFPTLRHQYDEVAGPNPPCDVSTAQPLVRQLPLYGWFSFLERQQQKMLWSAVTDIVDCDWPKLRSLITDLPIEPSGALVLNPDLQLPAYYPGSTEQLC